jgi:hypothetical protein
MNLRAGSRAVTQCAAQRRETGTAARSTVARRNGISGHRARRDSTRNGEGDAGNRMSSVPTEGTHCGWLAACSGGGAASGDVASSVETRRCRSSCSLRSPTPPCNSTWTKERRRRSSPSCRRRPGSGGGRQRGVAPSRSLDMKTKESIRFATSCTYIERTERVSSSPAAAIGRKKGSGGTVH